MPAFFMGLFGSLVSYFAEYLTKKIAIRAAAIAAFTGATLTFASLIKGLVVAIAYSPAGDVLCKMSWLFPSNVGVCVSSVISAMLARWLFDQSVARIKFMAM